MPKLKLTSFGAAGEVTGSCHLLNIGGYRLLVDCGMWQGGQEGYLKNWDKFLFDVKSIDAVILTHAHLDHCGRLAKLYAHGYKGKVYATPPTIKLAEIVLTDSFNIMKEKAARKKLPMLHSSRDLKRLYESWKPTPYYNQVNLTSDIKFKFHNAGHILGSAIVEITAGDKTVVFSGDIGGHDMPLVKDIDYVPHADYVVCEGTYGDRVHEHLKDRNQKLIQAVQNVTLNNSTLLITIFAIERTQDILKVLNDYYESHLDFRVPVYLDSPMAATATKVYKQELEHLNPAAQETLKRDKDIFNFPHLDITNNIRQSKKINSASPPKIIMAGSGMAEGGRMIHHFAHYLSNNNNHVLFMGFQVPGTLGHKILNGEGGFNYYGKDIPVRAQVDQIDGFSAHGDLNALMDWLDHFEKPQRIVLAHGDQRVLESFEKTINDKLGYQTTISRQNIPINLN
ncbi:MBL fold metallo-hydrolase [Candidatus Parcubacteria bacterium]|jgi:metallo-beta-lactamase family protein|nr:MBL fold metallo-hydrolase [Candidatus Parcubacteria bacterium]MBT7228786.1 MBL fold metallo-hydrolase [Candidatus Parcubacteria bacterium]